MILERAVFSVSDINNYVKSLVASDENLRHLTIKGEISNFKIYPSGHIYFSLKDNDSIISAVMFSSFASKLIFTPKNGDEVLVNASLDVYAPRGNYQLNVYEMNQVGQGALLLGLEKLKKQLASEGLFDESRKRSINIYPKAIGVITAPNGAAIKDILFNIKRRYPIADIYVFPSSVQGENAPKELLAAFNKSQEYDLDTLIIGRGGGASEDLSAFNDETLVRAIATSKMQVIAAVGHEIDSTLVDYVADKRASTPTGAAELATIDRREIEQSLDLALETMKSGLSNKLDLINEELNEYQESLSSLLKAKVEKSRIVFDGLKAHLEAINPNAILNRGYSITTNEKGEVIKSINSVNNGEKLITRLKDGEIKSKVEK